MGRLHGCPHVLATIHFTIERYRDRAWVARYLAASLSHVLLFVSRAAEESFFGHSDIFEEGLYLAGRRHFAIPNCIDLDEIDRIRGRADPAALRRQLGLAGCKVIGMVGRLRPVKGHGLLLQAMPAILKAVPDAKVLLIGTGPDRDRGKLHVQARELGIDGAIVWAGERPRHEAIQSMTAMDVVAVPSRSEAFGLSAAEAMALGKPVVGTDIPGLREVVEHNVTGLLASQTEPDALARAVLSILTDGAASERMGAAGRRRVERLFSMGLYADRILRLYRMLGR